MVKHFVYSDWLLRHPNPLGVRFISFTTECPDEHTANELHRVLGDRRSTFRPDESTDSLLRVETLLKALMNT